ncbi:terminase gpA endonuclease subunit [Gimesia chilikensis]|uniref:terminase gpA endonuclease subunit n=1 Tax=Gimesia chilikensis TaxID=2605989 RepID=UPI003A8D8F2C
MIGKSASKSDPKKSAEFRRKESARVGAINRAKTELSQDVYEQHKGLFDAGPANLKRREKCRDSFVEFCQTYGKTAFNLKWCKNHYKAAEKIEDSILTGEWFALAMPRGTGKSTLARWGCNWAAVYRHSLYSLLVAATGPASDELLRSVKSTLMNNELLYDDFPDVCVPIRHTGGNAQRALGQTFKGKSTRIRWEQGAICLAEIPVEYSKAQNAIIETVGIDGQIRGRSFEMTDGEVVRPTFCILDDPQTRKSARSTPMTNERLDIINGDIAYLPGPTEPMGLVMPCTVIQKGDLADQALDHSLYPEFQGEKTVMVESFPENMDLWYEYWEIRKESYSNGGKGKEANKFYKANRAAMDKGCVVTWEERYFKKKGEISAIQHAMNLFLKDEASFFAEYQNDPKAEVEEGLITVTANDIAKRVRPNLKKTIIPASAQKVTAMIDLSKKVLWYSVCAFNDEFGFTDVDYGAWPEQNVNYFTLSSARISMQMKKPGQPESVYILNGLNQLTEAILGKEYKSESGGIYTVTRCLIDEGKWQDIVHAFIRQSKFKNIIIPSKGRGIKASSKPLVDPNKRPASGEKNGHYWKTSRKKGGLTSVHFDANYWKTFIFNALHADVLSNRAFTLYDAKPHLHKMISEQLMGEYPIDMTNDNSGVSKREWHEYPDKRDNHFLDTVVGCCVAASMEGIKVPEIQDGEIEKPKKKKISLAQKQAERRGHA